jgi:outer membrane protein OmpA-like peptidoglycan-associated protein
MRYRFAMLGLCAVVAGCQGTSPPDDKHYSIFFPAYSADLDAQAHQAVDTAAAVAQANPTLPITVAGFASPPDPSSVNDPLSAQRAVNVKLALVGDGVTADRISVAARGTTNPNGKPALSVQRVDISIGK